MSKKVTFTALQPHEVAACRSTVTTSTTSISTSAGEIITMIGLARACLARHHSDTSSPAAMSE